jgi:hypothetical protein
MISQAVRLTLLVGLLIFAATPPAAVANPAHATPSNHGPVDCGPGPSC